MGVVLGGTGTAAANLTLYDIVVEDWWHSLLAVQTSAFFSSNVQIGQNCNVDRCYVSRGYGQYSGDVGVEIDSAQWSLVEDVTIEDAYNQAFLHTNFNAPPNPNEQLTRYRDCRARKLICTGVCDGFIVKQNNSVALNYAQYVDCDWYCSETTTVTGRGFISTVANQQLEMTRCRFVREAFTGSNTNLQIFVITQSSGTTRLQMDNCEIRLTGTISATPTGKLIGMYLDGGTFDLNIDNCWWNYTVASAVNNTEIMLWVSPVNATSVRGRIAACKFQNTVDAGLNCLFFDANTTQFAPDPLLIERNDFSGLFGAREIVRTDTAANKAATHTQKNAWKGFPAPTTLTGLTTAVGKALGTQWPALVSFAAGSGAGITAIDISTNNGTTYTNLLTQASGALPSGFSQSFGPFPSDALVKATFATTQPTINLIPVDP
jgi:hypothetical protein